MAQSTDRRGYSGSRGGGQIPRQPPGGPMFTHTATPPVSVPDGDGDGDASGPALTETDTPWPVPEPTEAPAAGQPGQQVHRGAAGAALGLTV